MAIARADISCNNFADAFCPPYCYSLPCKQEAWPPQAGMASPGVGGRTVCIPGSEAQGAVSALWGQG